MAIEGRLMTARTPRTQQPLPAGILEKVDLTSLATTVALLKMNAFVGLQATVDSNNHITRLGVTCAAVGEFSLTCCDDGRPCWSITSDRGTHYLSMRYTDRLADAGIAVEQPF